MDECASGTPAVDIGDHPRWPELGRPGGGHRLDVDAITGVAIANCAIQKPRELAEFLRLLIDSEPKVIVEIGVAAGGTLDVWQQVAPIAIGIDTEPSHQSAVIVGDSHDPKTVARLKKRLSGRLIDCLFIDGDHSYDGVRQDYEMYQPLVRLGGLIAFHDIAPILPGQTNVDDIQVKQFWDEIKDESAIEIIDTEDHLRSHIGGFGIGVLRNNGHFANSA
jgi:predicted O-methyltransferase YrrM